MGTSDTFPPPLSVPPVNNTHTPVHNPTMSIPQLSTPAAAEQQRENMRALIKAKHEEQAEVQRGILADMDHITEAELDKRHDISNTLDDEIDSLLAQYKRLSAALGVEPTPRGPCSAPTGKPQEPPTSKPQEPQTSKPQEPPTSKPQEPPTSKPQEPQT